MERKQQKPRNFGLLIISSLNVAMFENFQPNFDKHFGILSGPKKKTPIWMFSRILLMIH